MRAITLCISAAFAVMTCFVSPALAEDCKPLARVTQVPMTRDADGGRPLIPVEINGQTRLMMFDSGGVLNFLSPSTVKALSLPTKSSTFEVIGVSGNVASDASGKDENVVTHLATADTMSIGRMRWQHVDFFVNRDDGSAAPDGPRKEVGIIGPTLLKDYDVDIDFGNNTFSVMSADHCEGRVIYWQAPAVAVLDAWLYDNWHLNVPVTLDGKRFNGILDTGSTDTSLMEDRAERDLKIKLGSADAPAVGEMHGREGAGVYKHRFGSLSFDGIAVSNPEIYLIPDLTTRKLSNGPAVGSHFSNQDPRNFPDMLIGMDILKHFHMYIAYKESKVYITPATEPSAPAKP